MIRPKTFKKTTADLLIYLCKHINMRKYCKRELMDLEKKITSIIGGKIPGTGSRIAVLDYQIKILRKHLHKTAEKVLKNNNLTAKDISTEDFELGSQDLLDGFTEFQSVESKMEMIEGKKISVPIKTYFYHIGYGEIAPYTTNEDKNLPATKELIRAVHNLEDISEYIQFMKLSPF